MPKYLIEQEMPGAGNRSAQDLQGAARKSCDVLQHLGPQLSFPANEIMEVKAIIDPTTAEKN